MIPPTTIYFMMEGLQGAIEGCWNFLRILLSWLHGLVPIVNDYCIYACIFHVFIIHVLFTSEYQVKKYVSYLICEKKGFKKNPKKLTSIVIILFMYSVANKRIFFGWGNNFMK